MKLIHLKSPQVPFLLCFSKSVLRKINLKSFPKIPKKRDSGTLKGLFRIKSEIFNNYIILFYYIINI